NVVIGHTHPEDAFVGPTVEDLKAMDRGVTFGANGKWTYYEVDRNSVEPGKSEVRVVYCQNDRVLKLESASLRVMEAAEQAFTFVTRTAPDLTQTYQKALMNQELTPLEFLRLMAHNHAGNLVDIDKMDDVLRALETADKSGISLHQLLQQKHLPLAVGVSFYLSRLGLSGGFQEAVGQILLSEIGLADLKDAGSTKRLAKIAELKALLANPEVGAPAFGKMLLVDAGKRPLVVQKAIELQLRALEKADLARSGAADRLARAPVMNASDMNLFWRSEVYIDRLGSERGQQILKTYNVDEALSAIE